MTTLDERWGYYDISDWRMASEPGRAAAIDEALEGLIEEQEITAGDVLEVELCRCLPRCLSEWVDGEDLLERLDEDQSLPLGGEWGSVTAGWTREQVQARARELGEEVALVVARWCDRHEVAVPWWNRVDEQAVRVRIVEVDDSGYDVRRWQEVAP